MKANPSPLAYPRCHLGYVAGPGVRGHVARTAVWICEYPYRTMRHQGPTADTCADCPVWAEMQRARRSGDGKPASSDHVTPLDSCWNAEPDTDETTNPDPSASTLH